MLSRLHLLPWLLASLVLISCNEPQSVAQQVPEVSVIVTEPRDVPVVTEFVGKTESSRRVEIRSRVEGFLEKRLYEEGRMVKEGQTLFQMDPKPFEAQLNAAKAKVVAAELDLGYTTIYSPVTGVSSFARKREGSYLGIGQDALLTYVAQIQPMWVEFSVSENQLFRDRANRESGLVKAPAHGEFEVEIVLAEQKANEVDFPVGEDAFMPDPATTATYSSPGQIES